MLTAGVLDHNRPTDQEVEVRGDLTTRSGSSSTVGGATATGVVTQSATTSRERGANLMRVFVDNDQAR